DRTVTGVQTCALPISLRRPRQPCGSADQLRRQHIDRGRCAAAGAGLLSHTVAVAVVEESSGGGRARRLVLPIGELPFVVVGQLKIGRASCREGGGGEV